MNTTLGKKKTFKREWKPPKLSFLRQFLNSLVQNHQDCWVKTANLDILWGEQG